MFKKLHGTYKCPNCGEMVPMIINVCEFFEAKHISVLKFLKDNKSKVEWYINRFFKRYWKEKEQTLEYVIPGRNWGSFEDILIRGIRFAGGGVESFLKFISKVV